MADNTITVVGNVTRDPEMRYTPSGQAQTTIGLAVNRRWRDQQSNDWKEQTSYFDVVCWREMADNACESLQKGMRVIVSGRLEQRSWETQEGEKRSKIEIVADEIGPSLRWASAEVRRNERRTPDGGGGGGYSGGGRPAQHDAPSGGGRAPAAPAGGAPYDDEEPF